VRTEKLYFEKMVQRNSQECDALNLEWRREIFDLVNADATIKLEKHFLKVSGGVSRRGKADTALCRFE
jgi:hypothetical protein